MLLKKTQISLCSLVALNSALLPLSYSGEPLSPFEVTTQASQGYRVDKLVWSISGMNHYPNILSELTYKNVQIYQTRFDTKIAYETYFAEIKIGVGIICNGDSQDSDYLRDNRNLEFSRSYATITGDYTLDNVFLIGKNFHLNQKHTLTGTFGYGVHTQQFRDQHGIQSLIVHNGYVIKINDDYWLRNLNSRYTSSWRGPQIGLRLTSNLTKKLQVFGEGDFLFPLDYSASAFWNLRRQHFTHNSSGIGYIAQLGSSYKIAKHWNIGTEYQLSKFYANGGTQGNFYSGYQFNSPFRKAELTSQEIRLNFSFSY